MEKKEKKTDRDLYLDSLIKALQSDIQRRKETGEPLHTDTEMYILRDVPGRFGEDEADLIFQP